MTATVGIDVGGGTIKGVRRSATGATEDRHQEPTPATPVEILDAVAGLARRLGAGLPLGVGLAGLVDHREGSLVWAPHLPGESVAVARLLAERLGARPAVDNDANLAALAEHSALGGKGSGTTALITLGTGIGMGLVVDGKVFHGRRHAGEVGHVTVRSDGRLCACGRHGCWETEVSGRRLDADAVEVLGMGKSAPHLVAAAREGNPDAAARLRDAATWLALGVEAMVLGLDPDVVVIGGAVSQAGEMLLEPIRRRLARTEGAAHRETTDVRAGILGPYAGALGAAMAAGSQPRG